MEGSLDRVEVVPHTAQRELQQIMDARLRSLALLDRSLRVRQLTNLLLRGIDVEPIPPWLGPDHRAILVSNYPSVFASLMAVMKLVCRFPDDQPRIKCIARREVVTQAPPWLKALGVDRFVFPAQKDESGVYRLDSKVFKRVLAYLNQPGNILWLSMTGRTRGNGLLEQDIRTGAAQFAVKKGVPLVPMGLVTQEHRSKLKVVKVRFGEPIEIPDAGEIGEVDKSDLLIDLSKLAMCQIAQLLPAEQRGDFCDVDEKLAEASARLDAYRD
jgi:1-acyl-sn-glycerol-3-phosphate acyltransferase